MTEPGQMTPRTSAVLGGSAARRQDCRGWVDEPYCLTPGSAIRRNAYTYVEARRGEREMPEVWPSDLHHVAVLANAAAGVTTPAELPAAVLPGLLALIGADGAVHHWIDPGRRYEEAQAYPFALARHLARPDLMATYLRLMHQHPLLAHYARTGATGP